MRITKSQQRGRAASSAERWLWAAALLLVFGLGWLAGNGGWHRRLGDWMARFWRDPHAVFVTRANFPALYVDLKLRDYQHLAAQRASALASGAHLADETAVVPATLTLDSKSVDADLSLPEIEAAALGGNRWPFAVTFRDGAALFDMRQATLWPVDDAILWQRTLFSRSYRAALHAHGIPVTACQVVRLTVNGASWGLYVMEEAPLTAISALEGFSSESVLVYFDRRAYLEAQPVVSDGSFAYANIVVVPVGMATTGRTAPALGAIRADVVRILRGVEQGTYTPSAAFDPQTLADFMALTALWRGDFTLDWRSLYLLYDPTTRYFTPLGTGALPGDALPLPTAFTADPAIQRAYAQALVVFSDSPFLAAVQQGEDGQVDAAVALGDVLTEHQSRMRSLVSPSRTLVAAVVESASAWQLSLTNVTPFPVEVLALDVGERALLSLDLAWVVEPNQTHLLDDADAIILPAQTGESLQPVVVHVPLAALREVAPGTPDAVAVVTRIWGLDAQIVVPAEWENE